MIISKRNLRAYIVLLVFTTRSLCLFLSTSIGSNMPRIVMPLMLAYFAFSLIINKRNSFHCLLIIIFYLAALPATITLSKDYISYYSYAIQAIGITFVCSWYFSIDKLWALRVMRNFMIAVSLLNVIVQIFAPSGIVIGSNTPQYLVGIRIEFTAPYMLTLFLCTLYDVYTSGRLELSRLTKSIFIVCFISLMAQSVSTGLVAFVLSAILVYFYKRFVTYSKKHFWVLLTVNLALFLGIVVFSQTNLFNPILNLLGENATFSNRTYIWTSAISNFLNKPIWGHGITMRGAFDIVYSVNYTGDSRPAHNQFLHVLYEGGIIQTITYIAFFVYFGILIRKQENKNICCIVSIFVFIIGVMSIVEIQSQRIWLFILLAVSACMLSQNDKKERDIENYETCRASYDS